MIASIQFRHFKALRSTSLQLQPFNLIIGPNGSGKTSLIQAILRLRSLSQLPAEMDKNTPALGTSSEPDYAQPEPELVFRFTGPNEKVEASLHCRAGMVCDKLAVSHASSDEWDALRHSLRGASVYFFDHFAMAMPCSVFQTEGIATNGANLATSFYVLKRFDPSAFEKLQAEVLRLLPEFQAIEVRELPGDRVELGMILKEEDEFIPADSLSQGTLYLLGFIALAFDPRPPGIVCIEDVDRGIHPRLLREVRDLLYRLSYPASFGMHRPVTQVIATTHSPFMLDQFRDHPEEVVIAQKQGRAATFQRLIDLPDVKELLEEGSLGDLWYSGVLGGVPEELAVDPRLGASPLAE